MEVTALALQQAMSQINTGMSMVKKNAQAEQAVVGLLEQAIQSGGGMRGQNLDITA